MRSGKGQERNLDAQESMAIVRELEGNILNRDKGNVQWKLLKEVAKERIRISVNISVDQVLKKGTTGV